MKKTSLYFILLTLFLISGCFKDLVPAQKSKTSTTDNNPNINTTELTPPDTSFSDNIPGPLILNLMMAGGKSWTPGSSYTYEVSGSDPVIDLTLAKAIFASDSRLKLKFKVLSQPVTDRMSEEYCYGRIVDGAADSFKYQKLKFDVRLRDIIYEFRKIEPNTSNFFTGFYIQDVKLGSPYGSRTIGPIEVGKLSESIDFSRLRNSTSGSTVVEITNVKSDSDCQYQTSRNDQDRMRASCPSEYLVREQSCWHLEMYISTDSTQDI